MSALRRPLRAGAAVLSVVLATTGGTVAAQAPETTSQDAQRDVDVAQADRAEVRRRLAEVDAERNAALAAFDQASAAVTAAEASVREAEVAEEESRRATDAADAAARQAAVSAYVGDLGAAGDVAALVGGDAEQLSRRTSFLEVHASRRAEMLRDQQAAHRALAAATAVRRDAVADADRAAQAAQARLSDLEQRHDQTVALVAQLDDRVEDALAEAAALEAVDSAAAGQLVSDEQALRDAAAAQVAAQVAGINASRSKPGAKKRPTKTTTTTTAPRRSPPTTRPAPPTTARPVVAVPATAPPTTVGTVSNTVPTTYVPPPAPATTVVNGIRVATTIAEPLRSMMAAATAAGLSLGGSGYRDPAIQVELRRAHCGPTDYDIWERPAAQCSPPTARPGRSMHEQGLAVDLTCNGLLIGRTTDPCFVWLRANAATHGFYNLPSEPWHWSTNGN